jgi:hypothetical protein
MGKLQTILMFVAVLPAFAGPAEPAVREMLRVTQVIHSLGAFFEQYGNRNSRRVHAPTFFVSGDALNSVTAAFI